MATEPVARSYIVNFPKVSWALAWSTSACMLLADVIALSMVYWLAVVGRYVIGSGYQLNFYLKLFPFITLFLLAFLLQDLYPGLLQHPVEEMRRVFYCVSTVVLLVSTTAFLWRNAEAYSRSVFLILWAAGAPTVVLARHLIRRRLGRSSWWGIPTVILGSGPVAQRAIRSLRNTNRGLRVTGVLTDEIPLTWANDLPPIIGELAAGPQIAAQGAAKYAIVALPYDSNVRNCEAVQQHCIGFRHVLLIPDLPGICSLGISAYDIGGEVGFELPQRLFHRSAAFTKRLLDLSISSVILIVLAPVFLLLAVLVTLTSRGPVLFAHPRYGRDGKVFRAFKFRTMVENADAILSDHLKTHPEALAEWQRDHKLRNDPRVTAVGKWMRQFSIDEVPQLLNVLFGQMSLVGPRPIVNAEIAKYAGSYDLYTRVLPGLTGLWQVSGRNNTSYQERVAFDEYYVRNWSVWLDAYILIRTVKVVMNAEGAY